MRRPAPSLVLTIALAAAALGPLAGCRTPTAEDRQVVSAYLENAAQYYDAGHFARAFQQWGRALELDPDEDRAKLGQAMALYQLGREPTKDGVAKLTESERRLAELRGGGLGDQGWKADLGYALVQMRWAELYERAVRVHETAQSAGRPGDPARAKEAREELPRRVRAAEEAFRECLANARTEPNFQLTAWLGLARATAMRGALEESLRWCRKFEEQVVHSTEFWRTQGDAYASKLFGAMLQEAELRDVLANTLFKLGKFEESEKELDRLVSLQPNRASAYLNRGRLREARAAWDLARADYGRFLELTDLPADDEIVLEAEKRRLLCVDRLDAEDARLEQALPR